MLFHVALLVLLVGLAYGKAYGYRGQAAIVEGETWANARVAPNRPMTVDGVRVFQSDYGYVPVVRVQDRNGKELLAPQEVLTLRDPASEVSNGAVKVTRSTPQVGLQMVLFTGLRTGPDCPPGMDFCNDPRLSRPVLVVLAYQGDLQADRAQSVFSLDHSRLRPLGDRPLLLPPGRSGRLANGMVVSFTDLKQYSVLTLARDPGVPVVAVGAALLLCGLIPSLYVTRRRVWVRAVPAGPGTTRVELAGLALQGKPAFEGELARLAAQVERGSGGRKPGPPEDRGTLNDAKDHAAAEETRP
jgi:cytochrome c biogenesis protein